MASESDLTTSTAGPGSHERSLDEILLLGERERRAVWRELVEFVEGHLATVAERAVAPELSPTSIRAFLKSFTFKSSGQPDAVLRRVAEALARHQVHTSHPCYFGLFNPAASAMGIAADMLVAALNPQLAAWTHSPLAVEIERHLVVAFGERFGFAETSIDGTLTTGGAEANATALLCALSSRWPQVRQTGLRGLPHDPVLYLSAEGHHSFVKAARAAGLGDQAVRRVPVGEDLAMDMRLLPEMITADRRQGRVPFLVVGTAGTTGAGAIDPLRAVSDVAREEGLWLHVDAAWAGAVQLVPAFRDLLSGIERADSVTFDPHKWLSVPMGAGMFLTQHPGAQARAFGLHTGYMPREGREHEPVDPYAHSIQWSRRFSGLKLFLTLAVAGWDGYAAVLSHQIEMGRRLRERLCDAGWRIVNGTPLPVVCFTPADTVWTLEAHQAVADAVISSGRAWISTIVTGRGQAALRACVTNYRTSPKHIDDLIDALERARHVSSQKG